ANSAELSLTDKMAGSTDRVLAFLRDLAAHAKPVAERELAQLREFACNSLGIDTLQPWDVAYASEKLRQSRFAFSEEDVKPYFPAEAAIAGLFEVASRLFGLTLRQRDDVELWHPDARYYDVLDGNGHLRAGF